MKTDIKNILDLRGCTGYLRQEATAGPDLPITFDLRIEKSGTGVIELITSDPSAIQPLSHLHHNRNAFGIKAIGPEGELIDITDADIGNLTIGSNKLEQRHEISSSITIRRMSIVPTKPVEQDDEEDGNRCRQQAEYFVKGLVRTLGFSARLTPWTVSGNSEQQAESPNTVSARLVLELDEDAAPSLRDDFATQADQLIQRVLEVLSVSVGTPLAWSIRKLYTPGMPTELLFISTQITSAPVYPLFYSLNLTPAVGLALTKHTTENRKAKGLDVAIYWYLNYSPRAEAHYLHLMTALEHMVSCYTKGKSKARFDKDVFAKKIRPALLAAAAGLEEESILSEGDLEFIAGKLGNLNMASLRDGIEAMLAEWYVRFEDLTERVSLKELIELRNDITHRGALRDYDDDTLNQFWESLDILIELLKRIFMAAWGYQGRYISHLGFYHEAEYPPNAE